MSGNAGGYIFAVGNKTEIENEALYVILSIANLVHHGILPFSFLSCSGTSTLLRPSRSCCPCGRDQGLEMIHSHEYINERYYEISSVGSCFGRTGIRISEQLLGTG